MADLFENPMGLDGFEFVEFAAPDPKQLETVFRHGDAAAAYEKAATLYAERGLEAFALEMRTAARNARDRTRPATR